MRCFTLFRVLLLLLMSGGGAFFSFAQGRVEPPIMGWSSWNTYRIHISDSLIMRQADALLQTGLREVGYDQINIDDGFFGYRDERGVMHPHPTRFPRGVKSVVAYIHSLGLKAGIYSDAGANTCGSIWDKDQNGIGAGMYGHEERDAELYFNDWGFDFIKLDYCGAGQELDLEEEQRYREICAAIRRVVPHRPISVNICRWAFPGTWAREIATSWRISRDIEPSWWSVKYIIGKNLYLSAFASGGHYNDMDMLEIGRGLSPNEEEVHFGMWCLMSSPLLIGCDLTTIPEASLRLLKNKELIALNQDPLGLQAHVLQHDQEGGYVLTKDLEQWRGRKRAVAFLNLTDSLLSFDLPISELDLRGPLKVQDLMGKGARKRVVSRFLEKVPPRSIRIYRVEGCERLPSTRYEAEWAYLSQYNDLEKTKKMISARPHPKASGRMVVDYIGGREENELVWERVAVEKPGSYLLRLDYLPSPLREVIHLRVGDQLYVLDHLQTAGQELCSVQQRVDITGEETRISITAPTSWTPAIDCMYLTPLEVIPRLSTQ